jgi:hypothetical protein
MTKQELKNWSLKEQRKTAREATRILQEDLDFKKLSVDHSVRYKKYNLQAGQAAFGGVGEYGDDPEELAQAAAEMAKENDSVQAWANFKPRDSFGNALGGPNEQT